MWFWFLKKTRSIRFFRTQKFTANLAKIGKNPRKIRIPARFLVKIRLSQVFLDSIQNHVFARSALLEARYLEALQFFINVLTPLYTTSYSIRIEKGGGFFCPAPHFGGRGQNVALIQNGC